MINEPYIDSWLHLPRTTFNTSDLARKLQLTGAVSDFSPADEAVMVNLYHEDTWGISIPRQTAFVHPSIIASATDCTSTGFAKRFASNITLRPYQVPVVDKFMTALQTTNPYGGLLCAKPGSGKTVMGLEIVKRLSTSTLILVHKEFFLDQWRERINEFLPGARIGLVQQGVCDYKNKDIVIAMIQSLAGEREYPADLYRWPGVVITDEVHRLSAPTWSPVIVKFPAKVRIGLTATPRRKDGLEPVFFWHVGPIIARLHAEATLTPTVQYIYWMKRPEGYFRMANGKFNQARWVTHLAEIPERNWILSQFIIKALKTGRKILALSDRLKQLDLIKAMVAPHVNGALIDKYIGGMTEATRNRAAGADLILGTYQMAAEGLDIPDLDTLVMLSPKGDVEQAVGRIQRTVDGKKTPVVIDMVDKGVSLGVGLARSRHRIYTKIGANIRQ